MTERQVTTGSVGFCTDKEAGDAGVMEPSINKLLESGAFSVASSYRDSFKNPFPWIIVIY